MDRNQHSRREEEAVKDVIQGRELFSLEVLGNTIQGTCHLPQDASSDVHGTVADYKGTGILLISGLLAPRAGIGDSLVRWADSLAKDGYPCFRFDLPGTCDSGGAPPAELMSFINTGGYEAATVEIIKQLRLRYDLESMILIGHCSGAVTALFAASSCDGCRGLVLLEPYFHLPPPVATKSRAALSEWAASNRLGGILSDIFDRLKELRLRLRRSELPGNANFPLIKRWKSLASAGLPILILKVPAAKAAGAKPRLGEFDYLTYVAGIGGSRRRVDIKVIEGTTHSFADRGGRLAVRRYTESWLDEYFRQANLKRKLAPDHNVPMQPGASVSTDSLVPVSPGD
jgi:pimeloyl-ACP methyl ester carboxylesterase